MPERQDGHTKASRSQMLKCLTDAIAFSAISSHTYPSTAVGVKGQPMQHSNPICCRAYTFGRRIRTVSNHTTSKSRKTKVRTYLVGIALDHRRFSTQCIHLNVLHEDCTGCGDEWVDLGLAVPSFEKRASQSPSYKSRVINAPGP